MTNKIAGDLTITGSLTVNGSKPSYTRTDLTQEANAAFPVDLTTLRIHDAPQTNLPGTSTGNDLALVGTTFGTDALAVETADLKAAGATNNYARFQITVPHNYDSGQTITLRLHSLMITTVADATSTLDVEAYLSDEEGAKTGSDLYAGAALSNNSLTGSDYDFVLTTTSVTPGATIDVRITSAVNDAATGTEVKSRIGAITVLIDCKG